MASEIRNSLSGTATRAGWLVFLLAAAAAVPSDAGLRRQFYTPWRNIRGGDYQYSVYYYKVSPDSSGYRHHYAIFYPQRPDYIYYWDPFEQEYWGRAVRYAKGTGAFSALPVEERASRLTDIEEFPEPGPLPKIPEAEDDARMILPYSSGAIINMRMIQRLANFPPAESLPKQSDAQAPPTPPRPSSSVRVRRAKIYKPPEPPKPKYKYVTRYEIQRIPKVRYRVGFGPGGFGYLVPEVYYIERHVPVMVKVPADYEGEGEPVPP